MHNKSFTVDNQITIIGGRNIGDEYFGASEDVKFGDLDVAAVGPVVRDVSTMFDSYWNHKAAIPMPAISSVPDDPDAALRELREKVVRSIAEISDNKYAKAIRSSILDRLQGNADAYTWAPYQLIYDSPDKSQPGGAATAASITDSLRRTIIDAQKELLVITAYFVLRDQEIDGFREYRERGIEVFVLTNSLASNNHTISHSGYAPIRKPLLEAGIRLFELRADASVPGDKRVGVEDAKSTLHAKTFLVDRKRLFIGTFNWNQRSENLDTEVGVIIESEELAAEFAEGFFAAIEEQAYEVFLNEEGKLRWRGTEDRRLWAHEERRRRRRHRHPERRGDRYTKLHGAGAGAGLGQRRPARRSVCPGVHPLRADLRCPGVRGTPGDHDLQRNPRWRVHPAHRAAATEAHRSRRCYMRWMSSRDGEVRRHRSFLEPKIPKDTDRHFPEILSDSILLIFPIFAQRRYQMGRISRAKAPRGSVR